MVYTCIFISLCNIIFVLCISDGAGSPPKFKIVPIQDVVALVDGSHKFLCKVRGNPKPYLVWYHKNEMLSPNEK
jgi:hypothetical protein